MYEVPGSDITSVLIHEEVVTKNTLPTYRKGKVDDDVDVDEHVDDGEEQISSAV